MEQLALFAIPQGYTEEGEADSGNAAPRMEFNSHSVQNSVASWSFSAAKDLRNCEDMLNELAEHEPLLSYFIEPTTLPPFSENDERREAFSESADLVIVDLGPNEPPEISGFPRPSFAQGEAIWTDVDQRPPEDGTGSASTLPHSSIDGTLADRSKMLDTLREEARITGLVSPNTTSVIPLTEAESHFRRRLQSTLATINVVANGEGDRRLRVCKCERALSTKR
ncbi:uncharacterized protein L3040_003122 [Drepanopeziza brunnea f. sp. 'multigermtubi']|uniref:uncharacterized protein n=1 Tax=Drepanopeziza brunnea f. sp. 'multigermtubi' TaxID=698441 RepID=UPI00239F56CE|nr:hypothetical protein L3040_003122 [Drepanopeziza brunnea f. sp. 'multigermtubi']